MHGIDFVKLQEVFADRTLIALRARIRDMRLSAMNNGSENKDVDLLQVLFNSSKVKNKPKDYS